MHVGNIQKYRSQDKQVDQSINEGNGRRERGGASEGQWGAESC